MFLIALQVTLLLIFLPSHTDGNTITSDYVIVGGGTAGCIIASRLCRAFPSRTFTLLERGEPRTEQSNFIARAPRNLYKIWSDRSIAEGYQSLPDIGINNRTTTVLAGDTLGGSASIAGVQWTTPLPGNAERWGIKGLTTQVANRYYRKAFETMRFGPPQKPLQYADDYVRAGMRAGFQSTEKIVNQPFRYVWQNRLAINSEFRRDDTCTAYLLPVLSGECKSNLKLYQGVTASKILFSRKHNKYGGKGKYHAFGVETISSKDKVSKRRFNAAREVIVSAGPYGSPQLLQLSGLGTKETLSAAGVEQKIDIPVGENTVCQAAGSVKSTYTGVPDEPANNEALVNSPQQKAIWEAGKGGILATPVTACNGRAGINGYFGSFLIPFIPGSPELRSECQHNTDNTGFIHIKDNNPFTKPNVNYNLLSNPADVQRLISCMKEVVEIHKRFPPKFNMTFTSPANGIITEEYVRSTGNTGAHYVGGCRVGDVLTGDLKVRGTSGLRVIDASAIKTIPISAGPLSSVLMLAEYMSDQIIKGYC